VREPEVAAVRGVVEVELLPAEHGSAAPDARFAVAHRGEAAGALAAMRHPYTSLC
jgi:hypothetical protein